MSSAAPSRLRRNVRTQAKLESILAAVVIAFSLLSLASAQTAAPGSSAPPDASATQTTTQQTPPASAEQAPVPEAQAPGADQNPVAQPTTSDDQGGMFVFKKQVEEVVLHATVYDQERHIVTGLDRSAFSVVEEGKPQTITSFRREDVPVAIGIVVDNSGSMRDKRQEVNQALLNLVRASNQQDQVFVVNFSQNYYLDQDFTSNVNLLQAALHQVSAQGSTALYDAIVASAVHLNHNPVLEKKVLLVITDGQDNMSQETLQEATRQLRQPNGPTVYAIGLLGSGLRESGRKALEQLAAGTGGVAFFPDSLDQVDSITRNIARDIRSQYMIAYKPRRQNAQPNYQSVQVEAHAPGYGPLIVRTRRGYYQPEASH
jgi:Ca-activated chloride channel homolog